MNSAAAPNMGAAPPIASSGPYVGGAPLGSAGIASGGSGSIPMPGVCTLMVPDIITSTCPVTSEGGAAGAFGEGGAGAAPAWCERDAALGAPAPDGTFPVDDLEDRDGVTLPFLGGRGAWFAVSDGSGQQFPTPCALPSLLMPSPGNSSRYAMHTYGKGFAVVPGGFSQIGIATNTGDGCDQPIDASRFQGVEFRAMGSGWVRFFIGTVETNPVTNFGSCQGNCYDGHGAPALLSPSWQSFRMPFAKLVQEGWGTPAPFNPAHILTLEWSARPAPTAAVPVSCFDFWIDDVRFF